MHTRASGELGERIAAAFLILKGYRILDANVRVARREVDLVAQDGNAIVAVEVKLRWGRRFGAAIEAIDERKQRRMTQAALGFLKAHRLLEHAARFDVVAITWADESTQPKIEHFENAFPPVGSGQFYN